MTEAVGTLRGELVLDGDGWFEGLRDARAELVNFAQAVGAQLESLRQTVQKVGIGLTAALTAPLAALGVTSVRGASSFQAAMKGVESALAGIRPKQLEALADAAKALGPAVGKNAVEAADGIAELGRAGLAAEQILGGGLKATLDLAAAGMSAVGPAAALVTDVMGQFKKTTAELPQVVGDVVGALDASKFGFIDFQGAVAQGGGVAAAAGLSFRDFATAVAATSTQFSGGSDAGTSFKAYLQRLIPSSKEAAAAMDALGLKFFHADGRMKTLGEQAEMLRDKMGDLSNASKNEALTKIFGSDAARTAIGLMEQGRQGIEALNETIAKGDVGAKIAKSLEGEAAAAGRLSNAYTSMSIAIGATGLLDLVTSIKNGFARMLEAIANAPPALLKVGVVIGGLLSLLGPLALVLGTFGTFIAARFVAGFGLIGQAVAFVIAPLSTFLDIAMALLARIGASAALGALGGMFLRLVPQVALAMAAFTIFRDSVVPVLQQLWAVAQNTLGPPLRAIIEQLGAIFSTLTTGPIGAALASLSSMFAKLLEIVGTAVAFIVNALGNDLIRVFEVVLVAIGGALKVIGGGVQTISALLSGDFSGAWTAALGTVEAFGQGTVDVLTTMLPDAGAAIQSFYDGAKAALVDGFNSIVEGFTGAVQWAVSAVASAFPNITAIARSVYVGVKMWLVDKFGGLMTWIGNAATWIANRYAKLRESLGLGGGEVAASEAPPTAPAAVAEVRAPGMPQRSRRPKHTRRPLRRSATP